MNGLLYADNWHKSLYNYQYWSVFPECTWMFGMQGIEKAMYLADAEEMLGQRLGLQRSWM